MAAVAIADIKARIKRPAYEMLTGRDDSVCERAIATAELWAHGVAAKSGILSFDVTTEFAKEAIVLRVIAELYAYNEQEDIANDKMKMSREMLNAAFGSASSPDGHSRPAVTGHALAYEEKAWLQNY